jgi:hypothetical protein
MKQLRWRDFTRHLLQVVAFCCVIAVLTTLIWPNRSYWIQLAYSLGVGIISWAVMEFGRLVVDERHCHPSPEGGHGWPKGWRGIVLTVVGLGCGFLFGDRVVDQFWAGDGAVSSARDNGLSLVITLLGGGGATFYFYARGRASNLSAKITAAERDASEAKLKLLETQLEPHMLFNTLANLRALITLDPPRAVVMLDHLNNYLRVTLAGSRSVSHPLGSEFDRLRDYLELMSVRMGPRLRYSLELPEQLRDVPVPPLLLQPLVENSIRHGLEPRVEGGEIVVRAHREADAANGRPRIVIEVRDTGVGLDAARPEKTGSGFGVAQVRERLATAYGAGGTLDLAAAPGGGTCATAAFPI